MGVITISLLYLFSSLQACMDYKIKTQLTKKCLCEEEAGSSSVVLSSNSVVT